MLSEEQLIQNYEKYKSLLLQTGDHRSAQIEALIDHFGNRFVLCPASSKKQLHAAYPGGLIDHSLRVLKNATRMIKVAPDVYGDLSDESVVFATLFHDLGKLGDLENERYFVQDNDYYRKKGNVYELNQELSMTVPHASLFLLQHFGVHMSYDEFEAILLNDGTVTPDGQEYSMREKSLTLLVHQADRLSCQQEKLLESASNSS
jgi:hypothetical protein